MECLLWHSFCELCCCDLESVLNINKLWNKIEQEKCDLEMIVTSNLRLKKCLNHILLWKVWLWSNWDLELWQTMCLIHNWAQKYDLDMIRTEKVFLWLIKCLRQSCDLEFWLRKCLSHKLVWKVRLWNYFDLELWLRMGLEYN